MVQLREIGKRGQTINLIDPRKIKVQPNLNVRDMGSTDTLAHVAGIAASIEAQGFLGSHPLEVFVEGDDVFVAAGHCRLAACMALIERGVNIEAIPCLSEDRGTSQAQRLLNQVVSNSGLRLNLAEEGKVYKRLIALGYTTATVAKEAGRSEAHIRQAIDFLAAPQEAHRLVSEGKISSTLAASTIRKEGKVEGVRKIKAAVKTAEKSGKTKATAKHIEPSEAKPPKVKSGTPRITTTFNPEPACMALIRRIAVMLPLSDEFDHIIAEAVEILAAESDPAQSEAA